MTVATRTTVEWLRFTPESPRARGFIDALKAAADREGIEFATTTKYRGTSDLLLLWGPGAPDRFEAMRAQVASGGHVIALDCSYWQRDVKVRVSIDAAHPQQWVMKRTRPDTRFKEDRVPVANKWKADGPVLIAGIGQKARTQYGVVVESWEKQMVAECGAYGRTIWYRPKKATDSNIPAGTTRAPNQPIDDVLAGCSLVVTWHSNVAVDAIRMGVPVVCKDGAAAAICPSIPDKDQQPLPDEWRDRFLANLAWFQWSPTEARGCWQFVLEMLS